MKNIVGLYLYYFLLLQVFVSSMENEDVVDREKRHLKDKLFKLQHTINLGHKVIHREDELKVHPGGIFHQKTFSVVKPPPPQIHHEFHAESSHFSNAQKEFSPQYNDNFGNNGDGSLMTQKSFGSSHTLQSPIYHQDQNHHHGQRDESISQGSFGSAHTQQSPIYHQEQNQQHGKSLTVEKIHSLKIKKSRSAFRSNENFKENGEFVDDAEMINFDHIDVNGQFGVNPDVRSNEPMGESHFRIIEELV